jgi:glycerol-3-phosphate O-acyltransferase/dihydroxyacetone phosphate acyltransferase
MRILATVFYNYLWSVFNTLLAYFYRFRRTKHVSGGEKIPSDRPVLFCSNHPNAFMDALMLGSSMKRRTWFLARSDVFRKKWLAKFLSFLGIIPIYRLQEGAENLAKNDETFDRCTHMLEENKAIMVFSEGLCIQERRLRKLKKGTARIAFAAEEKNDFKLNLTIVPVGLNYSATPWKFRKPFFVNVGEPFAVKEYAELYRTDKARAMNLFTRELEKRMAGQLVIIEDPANDNFVAQLEQLFLYTWSIEEYRDPRNQVETHHVSKQIAHLVNEANKNENSKLISIREKTAGYFSWLDKTGTRDWVARKKTDGKLKMSSVALNYFLFVLLSPIWIFGVITNYIPYKVPYLVAQKIVKHIEWHASVNATMGVFLWQIYWLLQSLAVALIFRNWFILGTFMILVPVTGALTQEIRVKMKKTAGEMRFMKAEKKNKRIVEEMMKRRNEIVKETVILKEKYPLPVN